MSHYLYINEEITERNKLKFTSEELKDDMVMRNMEKRFVNEIEYNFDKPIQIMKN